MSDHEKINYVELMARDIKATKTFFKTAFGWKFEDYGPDYTAFSDSGLLGGFFKGDLHADTNKGSALVILYSSDLEATLGKVVSAGGRIQKKIFSFPGGRRFHFTEPSGNELAVWSDLGLD